jgi:hypothetical protein
MMWSRPQSLCGVALRAVLWEIALLVGLDGSPNPSGVFHYQGVIRPRATRTRRTFSRISSAPAVRMKGSGVVVADGHARPCGGDELGHGPEHATTDGLVGQRDQRSTTISQEPDVDPQYK